MDSPTRITVMIRRTPIPSARANGLPRGDHPAGRAVRPLPLPAEMVPTRGAADARIRSAPYDGDQVYRVRGFVGYQIDFEFEPGETFVGLGAGDIEGLSYFGQDNHLFLKPKAAKVATNLTVLTNRRRYQIDYSAVPQRPGAEDPDVIYAVRFIYPPVPLAGRRRAIGEAHRCGARESSAKRPQNVDYWYCGSPRIEADRRIGRRHSYAIAVRGQRGSARGVRPQRGRHRVAAQLQHGCGRCHHSSRRAAVHPEARQAHGLRRQSGIRRERPAPRVRHRRARRRARGSGSRRHEAAEQPASERSARASAARRS